MRALTAVNAIFAAGFLLVGLIALFGLGITGVLMLVPAVIFVMLAAATQSKSRLAVVFALAVDGVFAYFALKKLLAAMNPASAVGWLETGERVLLKPNLADYLVPSLILALVLCALVGVLMDWRCLRTAAWW